MVKKSVNLFVCEACGFKYKEKELAKQCEEYCNKHHMCSLEITKYAVSGE